VQPKQSGRFKIEMAIFGGRQMSGSKISLEQVRHVARLARLKLSAVEEESLQADMSEILTYVDKLNQLDTSAVEPTAQVGEAGTPMREDAVTNQPAPEVMLANAPARSRSFFRVPKIIE
jgi:aspartyl-tRNA(Asn)/glutamyl-tRNA(Gln) amidotransferase subunit C